MSDTSNPAQEVDLPQDEIPQDKILHLLQDCSNNLRHAKAQQWQAGYFTILAYGALLVAADRVGDASRPLTGAWPSTLAVIWSVLILAAGAIGVCMVWDLQCWMQRLRKSLSEAEKHCSDEYQRIAGGSGGGSAYHSIFYKSLQAWLITFATVAGWLIASAMAILTFWTR